MANFDRFINKLLILEGGYVNHPNDNGGCTNMGITLKTFQSFYGKHLTSEDLKTMKVEQAKVIYKKYYWDICMGDYINNQPIAELLVDFAINSGCRTAIKGIQRLLNVNDDGVMGKITLSALNDFKMPHDLFNELKVYRFKFYDNLVQKNPSQHVFLKGWQNRLMKYRYED